MMALTGFGWFLRRILDHLAVPLELSARAQTHATIEWLPVLNEATCKPHVQRVSLITITSLQDIWFVDNG